MNTPRTTVAINQANCDNTSVIFDTDRIFPAITLLIPIGVNHITPVTICMTTSNITEKKSMTTFDFSDIVPNIVPKTRQNATIPRVFVPALKKKNRNQNKENYLIPSFIPFN